MLGSVHITPKEHASAGGQHECGSSAEHDVVSKHTLASAHMPSGHTTCECDDCPIAAEIMGGGERSTIPKQQISRAHVTD